MSSAETQSPPAADDGESGESPRRILIIGSSGAGKSTLATGLGSELGLPVVHLDQLFWKAGWLESTEAEFDAKLEAALAQEAWIVDGNYSRTLARRLDRAEAVVFLDIPRHVCLLSVIGRVAGSIGRTRPDMTAGCPEHFDLSFLRWIWGYPARSRPKVLELLSSAAPGVRIVRLTRRPDPARVAAQLRSVGQRI